jgi:hypothetical protein
MSRKKSTYGIIKQYFQFLLQIEKLMITVGVKILGNTAERKK